MNCKSLGLLGALALCCSSLPLQAEPAGPSSTHAASALVPAPYLQPLSAASVAVQWETAQPAYGHDALRVFEKRKE